MGRVSGLIFLAINVRSSNISNDKVPLVFGYEVSTTTREKEGLSFPLGTGMVVLTIIFISAIFSFCYHWFRLKKFINPYNPASPSTISSTNTNHINSSTNANYISFSPNHNYMNPSSMMSINKTMDNISCPPIVFMAGEYTPRFLAFPSPLIFDSSRQAYKDPSCDGDDKVHPYDPKDTH